MPSTRCAGGMRRWPTRGGVQCPGRRNTAVAEQRCSSSCVYAEETTRARAPVPLNVIGMNNIAPAIMHYGTDTPEAHAAAPDGARRRHLVPRHVGARGRLRSGVTAYPRNSRRRRFRGQRSEGLDVARTPRRLVSAVCAHRRGSTQAQRHLLSHRGHDAARHRSPSAGHAQRRGRFRRGVLQRCPSARRRPARSARRGMAGRHHHAQP